jgi:hypothetical protein
VETIGAYFITSIQNFWGPTLNNPVVAPISEILHEHCSVADEICNVVISNRNKH